mmetsp:Transcript_904/g.1355  ORF Transcript_904/g.1355 Transcript_904/m.1355 type:complete len:245 (+) Transcript_904:76-810(+)
MVRTLSATRKKNEVKDGVKSKLTISKPKKEVYKEPKDEVVEDVTIYFDKALIPAKNTKGQLVFEDYPNFRPNLTPKEVMQMGSFGGTYFRPISSTITKKRYKNAHAEFPSDWFDGLNIETHVTSKRYDPTINKYKVKCGSDLIDWETKGWIKSIDPYGWFQWYCRFYMGRRTSDDVRQVDRGLKCFGPKGRWKINLMNKIGRAGREYDDFSISPVVRQTLQHWGYVLTKEDYENYMRMNGKKLT